MLKPSYTRQFDRDWKRLLKAGKDRKRIKKVIGMLINQKPLERNYKDHKLTGSYSDRRECHIEPDWLLIYKIEGDRIIFERTGTHSELFK